MRLRLPLRVRLTIAFAVGMAVVLAGLGAFLYWRVGADQLAAVDLSLRGRADVIQAAIHERGPGVIAVPGSLLDTDESFAQLLDGSGAVLESSSPAVRDPLLAKHRLASFTGPGFTVERVPRIDADPVRLLAVPLRSDGERRFLVVGATLGDRRDALERLVLALGIGGPVALVLTSVGGWLVAGGALRPVEAMRREASAISVSEPDRRLPVPGTGDELARLGATLNSMLDRLQQAFTRERRFVDDASHELRTPLSILKMELDLALARSRTPEELEAALRSASAETDRLARLAEDLLVLARAEHGRLPLHRTEVAVRDLLAEAVGAYRTRAGEAGVRIDVDAEDGTAEVDPVRVRQAVENLLDNSLRHSPEGAVVRVGACLSGGSLTVTVEDSGPGFPAELLDRAFDPFVRSASTNGGDGDGPGTGLGLTIVRAVAEAHGGTVHAQNLSKGGSKVTVELRVPDRSGRPTAEASRKGA